MISLTPDEIIKTRKSLKMTQLDFSKLFDVSVVTVQGWENGRKNPRSTAIIILRMLRIDKKATLKLIERAKNAR